MAAERMITAVGEPEADRYQQGRAPGPHSSSTEPSSVYPAFHDFFGMEDTIERIVGHFCYAAQGLEERKQILYLLGPRRRRQVVAGRVPEGCSWSRSRSTR